MKYPKCWLPTAGSSMVGLSRICALTLLARHFPAWRTVGDLTANPTNEELDAYLIYRERKLSEQDYVISRERVIRVGMRQSQKSFHKWFRLRKWKCILSFTVYPFSWWRTLLKRSQQKERVMKRSVIQCLLSTLPVGLKHCQRHNWPEGWVHLIKVTSWGHIINSNTNLDQIRLQNLD